MSEATEPASLRRHYREIYRYVRRRSRSDADAEDVTQDVFADAARALASFEPSEGPPIAWLYAVARRRLIDKARRQARRREVSADTVLELVSEPPAEYGREVSEALRSAIERLPRLQQEVVLMKLVQGRAFAEIAAALDAGEGACRMRFLRGLEQLRLFLEEQEVTP
ncbi:MAG TPA: RNA polymerase sigma factor [Gaiellaceae bacterium]|nr:RNA polymerase sigma factor [Gaiellaceae bacterium]